MTANRDLDADVEIADRLRLTWSPFFGRFGRLRPVQRVGIPKILDQKDVLMVAPTASGKTEAACAPLVEMNSGSERWTILYISPTRALVNDLFQRLDSPIEQLGLTIKRRTGDHRDPLVEPPNLLLTTPESFDSLLCRGRSRALRHVLGYVNAVVLDEVHLIFGTARGEQTRWLLHRLRRLREQMVTDAVIRTADLQVVALSATVPDVDALVDTYLGPDRAVVSVEGTRPIELVAPDAGSPAAESSVLNYVRSADASEKVLVFSNARKRVDELARVLATTLEPDRYEVRAHHGSLAQAERESVESAMKARDRIVVCATMTLEIGIDIGDVDVVVLDGPAPSVSSLLQRVGRGNRRSGYTRLMMCSGSVVESLVHAAMLDAARVGDLGDAERGPQYAVARQQLASYIFQAPGRSRPRAQLEGFAGALLPTVDAARVLDHLVSLGEFEEDASGVRLGREWLDLSDRGAIHSTIEDAGGYEVVDQRTGAGIGKGIRSQSGRGLGVAGKLLEVKKWDQFKIVVSKAANEAGAAGQWSYVSRAWMRGAGQPRAVQRYLGIPRDEWPVLEVGQSICVFHFGGARRRAVLSLIEELAGTGATLHLDDWTIWLPDPGRNEHRVPGWLTRWTPDQLGLLLDGSRLDRMERLLARPAANKQLPLGLRVREVSEWLALSDEREAFSRATWTRPGDPHAANALRLVARELWPIAFT